MRTHTHTHIKTSKKTQQREDYCQLTAVETQTYLFFVHANLVKPVTVKLLQKPKVGTEHKLDGCRVSASVQNFLVFVCQL